jgi:hypothetical protein
METNFIRPKYDININENYAKILYNNREYIFDIDTFLMILNYDKNFIFHDQNDNYPSFIRHNNKVSFLEFIYKFNCDITYYNFKNNNIYDLRRENVEFFHRYHKIIIEQYPNALYYQGHFNNMGRDANIMKNPYWLIEENSNKFYLMYCETDTIIKLDEQAINNIRIFEKENNDNKKLTFYKINNGYILCHLNKYIHQIITGCYGNGKGTKNVSVDHIDQDPLNNCFSNLRIATREEQEQNCKGIKENTKRERKHNAKPLPKGLTQEMMRKYVVYYKECYNKEKDLWREFFKVEKHPKLSKPYIGTKSNNVLLMDKLKIVNKIADDIENDIYVKEERVLPMYINIQKYRNKDHLVYDRRNENNERHTVRMIMPDNYVLQEQLLIFQEKINSKY